MDRPFECDEGVGGRRLSIYYENLIFVMESIVEWVNKRRMDPVIGIERKQTR